MKTDKEFLSKLNATIDRRIHEGDLSSETLAPEFCISSRHFNRKVNAVTGMNTTLYVRQRRIEKACALLRTTKNRISDIYIKCGWESANYFSRVFKHSVGLTPSDYRKFVKSEQK